jgi:hypothetical protein
MWDDLPAKNNSSGFSAAADGLIKSRLFPGAAASLKQCILRVTKWF